MIDWGELEVVTDPEVEIINDISDIEDIAAVSTKTTIQRKPAKNVSERLKRILVINTGRGGHLTVFMNKIIVFSLYGLSRQATTTLHYILEYYNTSQSSDRYNYLGEKTEDGRKPRISLPENLLRYENVIKPYVLRRWKDYQEMMSILEDYIFRRMKEMNNPRFNKTDEELRKLARKTATQYARIVFPAASTSSMIFSLNVVELARLYIISQRLDFGSEFRSLVNKMYKLVEPNIPNLREIIEAEMKNLESFSLIEDSFSGDVEKYKEEFSKLSKDVLIDALEEKEVLKRLDRAFFLTTGRHLDIEELKKEVMKFYSTSFGLQNVSPVLRCLENIRFSFAEEMTQYEFEQSVRHRRVRHFTNLFLPAMSENPDYVVPKIISKIPRAREILDNAMKEAWRLKKKLLEEGVKLSDILSLLPRGIRYRVIKTSDMKNYLHETILRLCLNAQQEINYHKYLEVRKLNEKYPSLRGLFAPRCVYRYKLGLSPFCPEMNPSAEGEKKLGRWCGFPVWANWGDKVKELEEREF